MFKQDKPTISIIVPVYNTSIYLEQCLNSIHNQSFKDYEVICVDDGSSDNSLHILKKYETLEQKDQVILDEENIDIEIIQNDYVNIQDEVIRHKVDKLALDIYAYLIR